jgi:Ca2+/Na+ antiporter
MLVLAARDVTLASPRSSPRAVIPFTSFSFGDVYRGEIISQIFVIKNEGDADLQIGEFTAGCGCEVTLVETVNGWIAIARNGKKIGFVKEQAILRLQ